MIQRSTEPPVPSEREGSAGQGLVRLAGISALPSDGAPGETQPAKIVHRRIA